MRKMVRLALAKAGHEVETAEDGPKGLDLFGDGNGWDIALVDPRMPGMDGRTVIREILRRKPDARVVMITSFDTIELAADVVGVGARDFLSKPFSAEMLRSTVDTVLRRTDVPSGAVIGPAAASNELGVSSEASKRKHFMNGFHYWPVSCPEGAKGSINRAYHVQGLSGEGNRVVVSVMAHVQEQIRQSCGDEYTPNDTLWDIVCGSAVMDYLSENASVPPEFIPLYELSNNQMEDIRKVTGSVVHPAY